MNINTLKIGRQEYSNHNPFIIAEVGQAHDGSLGLAHSFIDTVAKTAANAVKFQTHIADAESTVHESFRTKFSYQDKTRYDYWKRMEFTPEQWAGLKKHAEEKELVFLSSPFSFEAVEILGQLNIDAWKIGSGEVNNIPMLERILNYNKPILLSSGMSSFSELDSTVNFIKEKGCDLLILQTTTSYPCPPEKIGLNMIRALSERYHVPVGLSDHSGTIFPALAAVTLGAICVEVHVTLSKEMFGPDVRASVTIDEMSMLVEGVRMIARMNASPVDKDQMAQDLSNVKSLFNKSVVLKQNLPAGTKLLPEMLTVKKPGTGTPARSLPLFYGKILKRELPKDHFICLEDIE